MTVRQPRYSKEEAARLGKAIYEKILPQVKEGNHGKIVAIDLDSGAFEVADEVRAACDRLRSHHPDAQPWCERIGYRAVVYFGGRELQE